LAPLRIRCERRAVRRVSSDSVVRPIILPSHGNDQGSNPCRSILRPIFTGFRFGRSTPADFNISPECRHLGLIGIGVYSRLDGKNCVQSTAEHPIRRPSTIVAAPRMRRWLPASDLIAFSRGRLATLFRIRRADRRPDGRWALPIPWRDSHPADQFHFLPGLEVREWVGGFVRLEAQLRHLRDEFP
jgi:hypothetical protein